MTDSYEKSLNNLLAVMNGGPRTSVIGSVSGAREAEAIYLAQIREIEELKADVCDARVARNESESALQEFEVKFAAMLAERNDLRKQLELERRNGRNLHDAVRSEVDMRLREGVDFLANGITERALDEIDEALHTYLGVSHD